MNCTITFFRLWWHWVSWAVGIIWRGVSISTTRKGIVSFLLAKLIILVSTLRWLLNNLYLLKVRNFLLILLVVGLLKVNFVDLGNSFVGLLIGSEVGIIQRVLERQKLFLNLINAARRWADSLLLIADCHLIICVQGFLLVPRLKAWWP